MCARSNNLAPITEYKKMSTIAITADTTAEYLLDQIKRFGPMILSSRAKIKLASWEHNTIGGDDTTFDLYDYPITTIGYKIIDGGFDFHIKVLLRCNCEDLNRQLNGDTYTKCYYTDVLLSAFILKSKNTKQELVYWNADLAPHFYQTVGCPFVDQFKGDEIVTHPIDLSKINKSPLFRTTTMLWMNEDGTTTPVTNHEDGRITYGELSYHTLVPEWKPTKDQIGKIDPASQLYGSYPGPDRIVSEEFVTRVESIFTDLEMRNKHITDAKVTDASLREMVTRCKKITKEYVDINLVCAKPRLGYLDNFFYVPDLSHLIAMPIEGLPVDYTHSNQKLDNLIGDIPLGTIESLTEIIPPKEDDLVLENVKSDEDFRMPTVDEVNEAICNTVLNNDDVPNQVTLLGSFNTAPNNLEKWVKENTPKEPFVWRDPTPLISKDD